MVLLVYVDDIILVKDNLSHMDEVKNFLNENFKIKDLGQLSFFLGLKAMRSKKCIHINQREYALDILADCGMLVVKPSSTPMTKNTKLMFEQDGSIYE